ncbi:MAG TPA: ATP-binding cassette domain-containing protein [Rhizomicrobium sp.]|jgi:ATP-binding cassette subfamily F protein uup|nr:ATP-binding cassette domain-containing protein [Rhizomicrobium sp.]
MAPPLLLLKDIAIRFGDTRLLDAAELSVSESERLCLVGRNGSGKSTLLKIAAGLIEPDAGSRFVQPGVAIRYLPQEPSLSGFATTRDYVEAGLGEGYDTSRTFYLLGHLGLTGNENPELLSGGEARRAALAGVLAPMPHILLLDEPTNHLDLPAIEWLEEELSGLSGALVLISHDRRFLEKLSRATLWLDRGCTRRLERGFKHFEGWRDQTLAQEEIERHKLDRKIAMEEDWIRYGVTARRKRNVGRLARLGELRQGRREQLRVTGNVKLEASEADEGGTCVIEARRISKSWGDRVIVRDFSVRVLRGDRVGVVGANGAGKTTLINMLAGRLQPDTGTVKIGANVHMAMLDQDRVALDPDTQVGGVLTGGGSDTVFVGGEPRHVVSYLKDFLFTPAQARTPVRVLSGGERARLLLAKALAAPSNLLVLDEPTNDLDLETLDLLEEMLASHAGTVLVVSHDRDFLDRVATSLLMAEGDGRFVEYAGGYTDMLAQRGQGVEARAAPKTKAPGSPAPKERRRAETPRRKLSFTEQHELKSLPARMVELEKEIAAFHVNLSEATLYARDPDGFAALSAKLAAAQSGLATAESRWLELEMLREELERQ